MKPKKLKEAGLFNPSRLHKRGARSPKRIRALFVGSTYGPEGITVAVRIGFDDNRSLGPGETGGRVALPVFKEVMLSAYGEKRVGPVPRFPAEMEQHIDQFLKNDVMHTTAIAEVTATPQQYGSLRVP